MSQNAKCPSPFSNLLYRLKFHNKSTSCFFIIILLITVIFPLVAIFYIPIVKAAWLSGWNRRVRIDIDSGDVDFDLSSFPILIHLSNDTIGSGIYNEDVSFIFDNVTTNSKKIALTVGETEETFVEIESWSYSAEEAWLWANVSASSSTNTTLYLYYDSTHADNTAYVGDVFSTPAQNVWDDNFKSVLHFSEATGDFVDSTSNGNNATENGDGVTRNPQIIGQGIDLAGTDDYAQVENDGLGGGWDEITVELWANFDIVPSADLDLTSQWGGTDDRTYVMHYDYSNSNVRWAVDAPLDPDSFVPAWTDSVPSAEIWDHYVGTYERNDNSIVYRNGTQYIGNSAPDGATETNTDSLEIGRRNDAGTNDMDGKVDEYRLSDTARNASWIKATYETSRDDSLDFYEEEEYEEEVTDEEDIVDNNTSNVDGVDDIGSHSDFTNQQDCNNSEYDTLTEQEILLSEYNNVDYEIITHGSTTGIAGAQTKDDITENMTEGSSYISLFVDDFNVVNEEWSEYGDSPWLDDNTTNYIYTLTDELWHEEFTFENSSELGNLEWVQLALEVRAETGARNDYIVIDIHNGTQWYNIDNFDCDDTSYQWNYWTITQYVGSWTTINNTKLRVQYQRSGSPSTQYLWIRRSRLYINYTAEMYLEVEHVVESIATYDNYNLTVRAYNFWESTYLQMWNFTESDWVNFTDMLNPSLAWWNFSIDPSDFINATNHARIRYWQGMDYTQHTTRVDYSAIYSWNDTGDYKINLEIQWTSINYTRANEELCINTGSFTGTTEDLMVYAWNVSTTDWHWVMNLTQNVWNNASVIDWLHTATFTVRFLGGTETGDTSQNTWQIDCSLVHSFEVPALQEYNYTFQETINIDSASHIWRSKSFLQTESISIVSTFYSWGAYQLVMTESIVVTSDFYSFRALFTSFSESVTIEAVMSVAGEWLLVEMEFTRVEYVNMTSSLSIWRERIFLPQETFLVDSELLSWRALQLILEEQANVDSQLLVWRALLYAFLEDVIVSDTSNLWRAISLPPFSESVVPSDASSFWRALLFTDSEALQVSDVSNFWRALLLAVEEQINVDSQAISLRALFVSFLEEVLISESHQFLAEEFLNFYEFFEEVSVESLSYFWRAVFISFPESVSPAEVGIFWRAVWLPPFSETVVPSDSSNFWRGLLFESAEVMGLSDLSFFWRAVWFISSELINVSEDHEFLSEEFIVVSVFFESIVIDDVSLFWRANYLVMSESVLPSDLPFMWRALWFAQSELIDFSESHQILRGRFGLFYESVIIGDLPLMLRAKLLVLPESAVPSDLSFFWRGLSLTSSEFVVVSDLPLSWRALWFMQSETILSSETHDILSEQFILFFYNFFEDVIVSDTSNVWRAMFLPPYSETVTSFESSNVWRGLSFTSSDVLQIFDVDNFWRAVIIIASEVVFVTETHSILSERFFMIIIIFEDIIVGSESYFTTFLIPVLPIIDVIIMFVCAWFFTIGHIAQWKKNLIWGIIAFAAWFIVGWLWLLIEPVSYWASMFFYGIGLIILVTVLIGLLENWNEERKRGRRLED